MQPELPVNWFKSFWKGLTEPHVVVTRPHSAEVAHNFTPRAQQVLALARKEAARLNHNFVGTEHVLLGLISYGQGTGVAALRNMGIDLELVRREVEKCVGTGPENNPSLAIPYTPRVKKVLALAIKEARALNHSYVGTEHILLGLVREADGVAPRVLINLGVDLEKTRQEILRLLAPNSATKPKDLETPEPPQKPEVPKSQGDWIDASKRYDIYCGQQNGDVVVYRNARYKGTKRLFPRGQQDIFSEFLEVEQSDGKTVFIARASVIKFCAPEVSASGETDAGKAPG